MAEVTGSTATLLGGATARELAAAWPFADLVDVADAYESGDRIELRWQMYRAHEPRDFGEFVEAVGDGRYTATASRREEPGITYGAAEAVQVCVAEMNRLGVPSPEDLRTAGQTGISG